MQKYSMLAATQPQLKILVRRRITHEHKQGWSLPVCLFTSIGIGRLLVTPTGCKFNSQVVREQKQPRY